MTTGDHRINVLAERAYSWLKTATPAELWGAMQNNDIGERCGLPGVIGIGALPGPGDFLEELHKRDWAGDARGELAQWFASSIQAQEAARQEISEQIGAAFFELGEWEWQGAKMENEDDPVGATEPRARFAKLAEKVGLIRPGDSIDQNLVDFAFEVVGLCATIADACGDEDCGGNAGAHIRAELLR